MQVTNVRVSFLREKQPAQYEKAAPAVEFVATLDQGDDHVATARALMTDAATIVYAGIGYDVPERVAAALTSGIVPAELSVDTKTTEAAETAPEAARGTTATEDAKPKPRGRPKGSTNTGPKKETAAAKRKREAAEKEAAEVPGDGDVPGDEPKPNISTGEARINPEDGIPGDDNVPEGIVPGSDDEVPEFTPKDLHTMIIELVQATPRRLSVANAKAVLAHFKVARAQDLSNEQAVEGKKMVEEMLAETERQGG